MELGHVPPSGGGRWRIRVRLTGRPHSVAISFGHDRPWGGVSQHEYRGMAQHPGHPLTYRVHFAAIGWADRQGHAGFGPGRLAALLGKEGSRCPTRAPATRWPALRNWTLYRPVPGPPVSSFLPTCSRRARVRRFLASSIRTADYMPDVYLEHVWRVATWRATCGNVRTLSYLFGSSAARPLSGPTGEGHEDQRQGKQGARQRPTGAGQRRREKRQWAAYRPPQSQRLTTVLPRKGPTGASQQDPWGRYRAPLSQL